MTDETTRTAQASPPTEAVGTGGLFDPASSTLDPGAVIAAGRYRVDALVGRGGMAEVYRATDTVLDREVAVKVMHDGARDEIAEARFADEARVLGGLAHPGLVTVHDAGTSGGRPYIVMELVAGSSLAAVLDHRRVSEDEARTMVAEIAGALAVVHASDVIHRDVKPANILMGADGSVMLSDFGIARIASEVGQHTATGAAIGTVSYLAPEQVSGGEPSTAIDIYALGLVLLELVTGERAFTGTVAESAVARLAGIPTIPQTVSTDLRDLIEQMTALDPLDRPTAVAVERELGTSSAGATPDDAAPEASAESAPPPLAGSKHGAPRDRRLVWAWRAALVAAFLVAIVAALLLVG